MEPPASAPGLVRSLSGVPGTASSSSSPFSPFAQRSAALLVAGWATCVFVPGAAAALAFVPAAWPGQPWTLATAPLASRSLFSLLLNACLLLLLLRLVELRWPAGEALRFLAASSLGGLALAGISASLLALTAGRASALLASFSGGQGLVAALLVAVKQLYGEQSLALFSGAFRLRGRLAPAAYLLTLTVVCATVGASAHAALAWCSALCAWIYLRFHQKHVDGSPKGDSADSFALHTFIPSEWLPSFLKRPWSRFEAPAGALLGGGGGGPLGGGLLSGQLSSLSSLSSSSSSMQQAQPAMYPAASGGAESAGEGRDRRRDGSRGAARASAAAATAGAGAAGDEAA